MVKKIFIPVLILLFSALKSNGQTLSCAPNEDCGHWLDSSYTFEKKPPTIFIDTTNHKNQWQIARPHKIILDSALSPTHALITDSINPIIINDTSFVTLKIYAPPQYSSTYVQFHHKYDIDSIHQKAFVESSYDNGSSWALMDVDNYVPCDAFQKYWVCGNSDSTVNGPYFSGTTHSWKTSAYFWEWGPILARLEDSGECKFTPDSLLVRFVFENDSVAVQNEGWMIDNIDIYYVQNCGGINTPLNNEAAIIYPNPVDNYISIKSPSQVNYFSITNLYGQILINQEEQNLSDREINISSLSQGIYFIQYKDVDGEFFNQKFVKQ